MRKYLTYFLTTFKMSTAYKAGIFLGLFADIIFFVVQFTVWRTVFLNASSAEIGTYNLSDMITYYFIVNLIFRFSFMDTVYLGWQIWHGYFSNDLVKPWRVLVVAVLDSLAENFLNLILSIPVTLLLLFWVREFIVFPDIGYFFLFLVTLVVGFVITLLFALLLQSLTFFFGDMEANIELFSIVTNFLAGAFVPLILLPDFIQKISAFLPFQFNFFLPAQVFLQKIPIDQVYGHLGIGALWIIGLSIVVQIVFKQGLKHYTGTGR